MKIQIEVTDEQGAALQADAEKGQTTAAEVAAKLLAAKADALIVAAKRYEIYAPVRAAEAQGAEAVRIARIAAQAEEVRQGLAASGDFEGGPRGPRGMRGMGRPE